MNTYKNSGLKTTQGRWPSPDPAALAAVDFSDPQSLNRYAYVSNDPLALVDPLGLYTACTTIQGPDGPTTQCTFYPDGDYDPRLAELLGRGGGGSWRTWPCYGFTGTGCGGPKTPPPSTLDNRANALANALNGIGIQSLNPETCGGGFFYLRGVERELGVAYTGAYVIVARDSRSGTSVGYLVEVGGGPVSVGHEASVNSSSGQVESSNLLFVGKHVGGFVAYSNRNSPIQLGGYASAGGRGGVYVNVVPGGACHP
jgi:hypothetical protein